MTPAEARAAFLWGLTTPEQIMAAATTPELRQAVAEKLGVSLRTVQRHVGAFLPCPGPRCMTNVRGGGLCSWCRKSDPDPARMGTSRVELHNARIPDGLPVVLNPPPGGRSASSRLRR